MDYYIYIKQSWESNNTLRSELKKNDSCELKDKSQSSTKLDQFAIRVFPTRAMIRREESNLCVQAFFHHRLSY